MLYFLEKAEKIAAALEPPAAGGSAPRTPSYFLPLNLRVNFQRCAELSYAVIHR